MWFEGILLKYKIVIPYIHIIGQVLAATMDGASINRRLMKLHTRKTKFSNKILNPYADDQRYLYFFSDPPHLMKTTRNCLESKTRLLWVKFYSNEIVFTVITVILHSAMESTSCGIIYVSCTTRTHGMPWDSDSYQSSNMSTYLSLPSLGCVWT